MTLRSSITNLNQGNCKKSKLRYIKKTTLNNFAKTVCKTLHHYTTNHSMVSKTIHNFTQTLQIFTKLDKYIQNSTKVYTHL